MHVIPAPELPFATGVLLYRPRPAGWRLVIVAKMSFRLAPSRCALAANPVPLTNKERAHDGSASGSIQSPNDLVPFKRQPEYLVVGSAFAPPDELATELTVAVEVAGHRKALRVRGPMRREAPEAWRSRPLRWELALRSDDNPVGVGPDELPSIRPLDTDARAAGLGPISSRWPPRRRRLGKLAAHWSDDGLHTRVLDDRFDGGYFQAAPEDQWLPAIPADATLVLEHLHPRYPRLETRLPGVAPCARVERRHCEPEAAPLAPDTLLVNSDESIVTITWRGHVALSRPDEIGDVRLGLAEGDSVLWSDGEGSPPQTPDAESLPTVRLDSEPTPDERDLAGRLRKPTVNMPNYQGAEATAEAMVLPKAPGPEWLARKSAPADGASRAASPGETAKPTPLDQPPERAPGARRETPSARPTKPSSVTPPNPAAALLGARPQSETRPSANKRAAAKPGRAEVAKLAGPPVELVWHGEQAAELLRKCDRLAKLLPPPPAPKPKRKPKRGQVPEPPPPPPDPADEKSRARRDVAIALGEAEATQLGDLESQVAEALGRNGREPPLVIVQGMFAPCFDDAEALSITCRLAKPAAAHHKPLADVIALAGDAAEALTDLPALTRPLRARIEKAWRKGNRDLPPTYLEDGVRRALLEKRAYRKLEVLGARFIVAMLSANEGELPVYLPEQAGSFLPLYASFDARLLAQALPRQDEAEPHPLALSLLALGRRVAIGPGLASS